MRVEQNNFRDLFAGNLPLPTQAQHVLCMLATPRVTNTGLAGKERLKALTLQIFKNGNGWYPGIPSAA